MPGLEASPPQDATGGPSGSPGRGMAVRRWLPWLLLIAAGVAWGADRTGSEPASGTRFEPGPRPTPAPPAASGDARPPDVWRVANFNIHSAVGADGREDLDRVASVLKGPFGRQRDEGVPWDFAGLNEVRAGGWFGAEHSQAESLGGRVAADWLFAPAERQWGMDHYGNGALARREVVFWQRIPLPCTKGKGYRNLLLAEFAEGAAASTPAHSPVRLLVVHVDRGADRIAQLEIVFRHLRSLAPPAVLMGDLNTRRDDPRLRDLLAQGDVIDLVGAATERDDPERIDWILGKGVTPLAGGIVANDASDHPLVWSEFRVRKPVPNDRP